MQEGEGSSHDPNMPEAEKTPEEFPEVGPFAASRQRIEEIFGPDEIKQEQPQVPEEHEVTAQPPEDAGAESEDERQRKKEEWLKAQPPFILGMDEEARDALFQKYLERMGFVPETKPVSTEPSRVEMPSPYTQRESSWIPAPIPVPPEPASVPVEREKTEQELATEELKVQFDEIKLKPRGELLTEQEMDSLVHLFIKAQILEPDDPKALEFRRICSAEDYKIFANKMAERFR